MNVPKYPCLLCTESFYSKVSYEIHFYDCIKETSNKMTTAEKQIFEANEKFFLNGEEEFKLQAEQNRNYYEDLKNRLEEAFCIFKFSFPFELMLLIRLKEIENQDKEK